MRRTPSSPAGGGGDTTPPVGQRFKYFVFRLLGRLRAATRNSTGGGGDGSGVDGLIGSSQMILMGQPRTVSLSAFRVLFRSIMWFSYRSNFPMIPNSLYNSDTGWGCMLRSLQMVMAHAFQRHYSSSEWNVRTGAGGVGGGELTDPEYCQATRHQIIEFFTDDPSAPYSIHKLVQLGGFFGKKPGEWYGPALASHIARMANEAHMADEAELASSPQSDRPRSRIGRGDSGHSTTSASESDDGGRSGAGGGGGGGATAAAATIAIAQGAGSVSGFLNKPMAVFTAQDGVVATKEIEAYFARASSTAGATGRAASTASQMTQPLRWGGENRECIQQRPSCLQPASVAAAASEKSLLLLIPLRLGIHSIAQHHLAMLRGTLQLPQSVGFIGGSPAHSLYFVGVCVFIAWFWFDVAVPVDSHPSSRAFCRLQTCVVAAGRQPGSQAARQPSSQAGRMSLFSCRA